MLPISIRPNSGKINTFKKPFLRYFNTILEFLDFLCSGADICFSSDELFINLCAVLDKTSGITVQKTKMYYLLTNVLISSLVSMNSSRPEAGYKTG